MVFSSKLMVYWLVEDIRLLLTLGVGNIAGMDCFARLRWKRSFFRKKTQFYVRCLLVVEVWAEVVGVVEDPMY